MTERTVPKEFNDANIAAARRFKAERDALVNALKEIENTAEGHQCRIKARAALALVGGQRND